MPYFQYFRHYAYDNCYVVHSSYDDNNDRRNDKSFEFEELFKQLDLDSRSPTNRPSPPPLDEPYSGINNLLTYSDALSALTMYHGVCGNLIIPRSHPLSKVVYNFGWWKSHVLRHPPRVRELNALGFVWGRLQSPWNLIVESLLCYKSVHGHLDVPTGYVVNSRYKPCKDYPVATWGIELGVICNNIRSRNFYIGGEEGRERVGQLASMGFVFDKSESLFSKTLWAAREYKLRMGGNSRALKVPQKFKVPEDGKDGWPKELGGFR
ncbi:hypothetical protein TrRE_jg12596 [Triparma retinervis]|uniref:Uncharacterized protein n=1 Tax=Triparma retinervis TaxID=2557542 RepID=A0A9W6ZET0_9STRA|nr:hypothetical protein TrRE_jg12596 [Triparma retinervis]